MVLSRLTYSLYLLHPMLIMFVVYSRRTTIYLDPANLSLVSGVVHWFRILNIQTWLVT